MATKTRKAKLTRAESAAALETQAPIGKGRKGSKGVDFKKLRDRKVPLVVNAVDFQLEAKQYRNFDGESNWQPSENFLGQCFYVVKIWSFETVLYGSKVGYEIKFDPKDTETVLFSLTWTEDREANVRVYQGMKKRHGKVTIGPMTLNEVPSSNESNDYRRLEAFTDAIAEKYAGRAKKEDKPRKAKAAKSSSVKRLSAKHPGRGKKEVVGNDDDIKF